MADDRQTLRRLAKVYRIFSEHLPTLGQQHTRQHFRTLRNLGIRNSIPILKALTFFRTTSHGLSKQSIVLSGWRIVPPAYLANNEMKQDGGLV
jgi:hypothetical protein